MTDFKLRIATVVLLALSFCSAKSIGQNGIEKLFGKTPETGPVWTACELCGVFIVMFDEAFPEGSQLPPNITAERIGHEWQKSCAPNPPPPIAAEFCKAIHGKEMVFGELVIKHHKEGDKVNPCKELNVC